MNLDSLNAVIGPLSDSSYCVLNLACNTTSLFSNLGVANIDLTLTSSSNLGCHI